jgi:signal transduction histidine kinase
LSLLKKGRYFNLAVGLLSMLAVIGAVVLVAYWRSPSRGLPYHDSFGQGKADEWKAFGGTWELFKQSMRNDSDERGAKLISGSPYWENYSIEADVMLLGLGGDAGLILRSSDEENGVDSYSGYYAGLRSLDNAIVLGRAEHGWIEFNFPLKPQLPSVQLSHWYHLKALAYGCQLAATVTLPSQSIQKTVSITDDDCLRSGRVGLRSYASGGVWRNVVVQKATKEDLEAMLARVQPQQASSAQQWPADDPARGTSSAMPENNIPQALPSGPNAQPISSLRLIPLDSRTIATVRGIVILTSPAMFVEDSTGGVRVQQADPRPLKVGDEVEVTGEVHPSAFSSTLEKARVRVLWEGTPMPAVSVTASQAATGGFDSTFIEVEGRLRNKQFGPEDTLMFDFDAGPQAFRAIMNRGRGDYLFGKLKPGSLVRLRGVCVVDRAYTHDLTPFVLLLRSTDDIDELAGPPWWSTEHLVEGIIGTLLLALVANFFYSRAEHWRLRAVLEERRRLAHEIHDTLAQSFAGIGFQLEAIRNGIPKELPATHQQLDLARDLVRHSHEEARRSIATLRPDAIESGNLLTALDACARHLVEGGTVIVESTCAGDVRSMPLRNSDTLYRIGQEAIANAVRHAHPSRITVSVAYSRNVVRLIVADDGAGFLPGGDLRGFGVRGMRKRAASISATLQIISRPGAGSRVQVDAPLPPRIGLISWPKFLWKYLREHPSDAQIAE